MRLNFKKYFSKGNNWFVITILLLTILYGLFAGRIFSGLSNKLWKNWEDAAVVFTLIYTIWLYLNGFFILTIHHITNFIRIYY